MLNIIAFFISMLIGSGTFLLPGNLSIFGFSGIFGLSFITLLFLLIGYTFANISKSPFELLKNFFGYKITFLISWAFWIVCWISNLIVINEILLNLSSVWPVLQEYQLFFQIGLVLCLIAINMFGVQSSGNIEVILTIFKIGALILIPVICFLHTKSQLSIQSYNFDLPSFSKSLPASIFTFVGIESIMFLKTDSLSKKKKAFLISFIIVVIIYFANLFGVYKILGFQLSIRPYIDLMQFLFGDFGIKLLNAVIVLVCLGTLNACTLSYGLMAYDLSINNIFPKFLQKINSFNSPYLSIIFSSIGIIPVCFLMQNSNLFNAIKNLMDYTSGIFILFYACICFVIYKLERRFYQLLAFLICFFAMILCFSTLINFLYSSLIIFSGVIVLLFKKIKNYYN